MRAGKQRRVQVADDARCEQIHRRLKRIAKVRAVLDLEEAAALRDAEVACIWRRYGCASLLEYLERELGYTPRVAKERLRVASLIDELPQIREAMMNGELSFSAVRELTRVASAETESEWLAASREMNQRELEELVAGHKRGDRPTDRPDPARRWRDLHLKVRPETYALMRQAQQILNKERGERLDDDAYLAATARLIIDGIRPLRSSAPGSSSAVASSAAAVSASSAAASSSAPASSASLSSAQPSSALASSAVGTSASLFAGGSTMDQLEPDDASTTEHVEPSEVDSVPYRTRAPYQIAVTVCRDCKRGWQDGGGITVEMSPVAVERAWCDAEVIGSIDGAVPERAKQAIAPSVRRLVWARDHGRCRVPGCRSSTNLDVHHIEHLEDGGSGEPINLILLCEGHHLAHHAGNLIITGTAAQLTISRRASSSFEAATRVVETTKALATLGYSKREAREAAEQTRTHVGSADWSIEAWIKYALSKCPRS
ncbi:MAG: HNH endonuclease [Kofleriaceae bacterium]|nr:HNH endonuclease [Kofleriaceae bacterium]